MDMCLEKAIRTRLVPDIFTRIASLAAFFSEHFSLRERVSARVNSGTSPCTPMHQSSREEARTATC